MTIESKLQDNCSPLDAVLNLTGLLAPATSVRLVLAHVSAHAGNPISGVAINAAATLISERLQLVASKNQFTGTGGDASSLFDGFSVVPAPIVGAGLPGLVAAFGGLIGLARRRRRQIA